MEWNSIYSVCSNTGFILYISSMQWFSKHNMCVTYYRPEVWSHLKNKRNAALSKCYCQKTSEILTGFVVWCNNLHCNLMDAKAYVQVSSKKTAPCLYHSRTDLWNPFLKFLEVTCIQTLPAPFSSSRNSSMSFAGHSFWTCRSILSNASSMREISGDWGGRT